MERKIEATKQRIDALLAEKDRVIVSIDGCCTSGKTTLAGKLAELYDCDLFTWMIFFCARSSGQRSGSPSPAAMWIMSVLWKRC